MTARPSAWKTSCGAGVAPAHVGAPPPRGRPPGGRARPPEILPPQEGVETTRGSLAVPKGLFAGAGPLTNRFGRARGDRARGELPRVPQARPWPRVTPGGVHAVARLLGKARGRDAPADLACFRQIASEPGPTRARLKDQDQRLGLRGPRAEEVVTVTWACAEGPAGGALGAVLLRERGHRAGLLMASPSDRERARLGQG